MPRLSKKEKLRRLRISRALKAWWAAERERRAKISRALKRYWAKRRRDEAALLRRGEIPLEDEEEIFFGFLDDGNPTGERVKSSYGRAPASRSWEFGWRTYGDAQSYEDEEENGSGVLKVSDAGGDFGGFRHSVYAAGRAKFKGADSSFLVFVTSVKWVERK